MPPAVVLHGFRDLNRAFAQTERDVRLGWRRDLRHIAEPVRLEGEQLAAANIRNIGTAWPRMRTGVTRNLVYVAPRQKGVRGRGPRRRPNLADLLMDRAMEPALKRHSAQTVRAVEQLLEHACDKFNRGGPL